MRSRAIEMVTTGLQWRLAQAPVSVIGAPTPIDLDACWELGASVAAGLASTGTEARRVQFSRELREAVLAGVDHVDVPTVVSDRR